MDEQIEVGDYVLLDFRRHTPSVIRFAIQRKDFNIIEDEEMEKFSVLLSEMDLWEDTIDIQKKMHDLKTGNVEEINLEGNYKPNKYLIKVERPGPVHKPADKQNLSCKIKYSESESLNMSRGARGNLGLEFEELQIKLKNLNNWLKYKQYKKKKHEIFK